MINARSIATLGIGFGALAIVGLGFIDSAPVEAAAIERSHVGGGGWTGIHPTIKPVYMLPLQGSSSESFYPDLNALQPEVEHGDPAIPLEKPKTRARKKREAELLLL